MGTRTLKFIVKHDNAAEIISVIKYYVHIQNLYILLREELYRKAEPEKFLVRFNSEENYRQKKAVEDEKEFIPRLVPELDLTAESKVKHKILLSYFSEPKVVRAFFQEANPEKAKLAEKTKMDKLKLESEEKYQEAVEKKRKYLEQNPLSTQEKASFVRLGLANNILFTNLLETGQDLNAKTIFNLIKRVKIGYDEAFRKFKETGVIAFPRTKALDSVSAFYLDLCDGGFSIKKNQIIVKIKNNFMFNLDLSKHELSETHAKIGFEYGKVVFVGNYTKIGKSINELPVKYAGIDIGINNLGAIFIDDDYSHSQVFRAKSVVAQNARYNEKLAKLSEIIDLHKNKLKEIRKEQKLKHFECLEQSEEYKSINEIIKIENAKREKIYEKRQRYFFNVMHKAARRTLEQLAVRGVTTVFISRNLAELKTEGSKIAKKQRRRFHQIPLIRYLDYIELNADEYGINVINIDEAYTSKVSALNGNVNEAQKIANDIKNAKNNNMPDEVKFLEDKLGTIIGGSRVKGKFTIKGTKSYFHSDVGGAANHIQVGLGRTLDWTKEKRLKLFSPRVFDLTSILDIKHEAFSNGRASLGYASPADDLF